MDERQRVFRLVQVVKRDLPALVGNLGVLQIDPRLLVGPVPLCVLNLIPGHKPVRGGVRHADTRIGHAGVMPCNVFRKSV